MLRQRYRLRRSVDVDRVRREGRSWHHPLIVLVLQKNDQDISRFAFVASRRVGKAVVRNRVKRLMREAVRLHLSRIAPGWDCLLIARAALAQATFAEVETAVLTLLRRAQILGDAV